MRRVVRWWFQLLIEDYLCPSGLTICVRLGWFFASDGRGPLLLLLLQLLVLYGRHARARVAFRSGTGVETPFPDCGPCTALVDVLSVCL